MNKVILMGRLTRDPELRYTAASNIPRCTFTLAVDRRFSKPGEEKQADFINIVAWRNQAEFCSKYFTKGMRVAVVGSLQNRSWDDNEGKKHYITEVIADEVHFADSRRTDGGSPYGQTGGPGYAPAPAEGQNDDVGFFQTDDDDLPF
ncbi:MAG: single-stranded DNA-binding protein [Acetivibrionales bacterium]|jgi:single-strand DNA-binding protein|nr:single-stranded DNA-binding protein [Bacillota bacterium]NLP07131.1 single-stranded DNA-binding protein [Clostridiaceae bacterium]HOA54366.1 single-stranded DNA-binding protein [Clostridiales bacterium]HPZ04871.1 single-stranded DNA-binding protein [Clostridiales bacterium]HQD31700.1 single-stranded DNA-binding protein [Clostridiales bacterium]